MKVLEFKRVKLSLFFNSFIFILWKEISQIYIFLSFTKTREKYIELWQIICKIVLFGDFDRSWQMQHYELWEWQVNTMIGPWSAINLKGRSRLLKKYRSGQLHPSSKASPYPTCIWGLLQCDFLV